MKHRILLLFLLAILVRCGIGSGTDTAGNKCTPNYSSSQFSVYVQPSSTGPNSYRITVCDSNRSNSHSISIYGVYAESDLAVMDLNTHVRLPHLETSSVSPGDVLYVTFSGNDYWFGINEDDANGNFSRTNELVSGQLQ